MIRAPGGTAERPTRGYIDHGRSPETDLVQLWLRRSFYVGDWAFHPYFVAYDRRRNRWLQAEVWADDLFGYYLKTQTVDLRYSDGRPREEVEWTHWQVGAVRIWEPLSYIDESPTEHLAGEWVGDEATRVLAVLRDPERYPDHDDYMIWPGPNSNGYARWVLDEAAVGLDLDPRMIGKDWHGPLGFGVGLSPTRTGVHADLLTFGATVGLLDGIELHLLGMTWGVDVWPPALKTPLGRFGLPE